MYQADIVIRNRKGNMGLAVELRAMVGQSSEWAAKTRQNLAEFGSMPDPTFFLLATPDRFFFWTRPTDGTDNLPPAYSCDTGAFLGPFFERCELSPETVHHDSLELIMAAWLADLIYERSDVVVGSDPDASWLVESGFVDEIRNGRLEYEVTA